MLTSKMESNHASVTGYFLVGNNQTFNPRWLKLKNRSHKLFFF